MITTLGLAFLGFALVAWRRDSLPLLLSAAVPLSAGAVVAASGIPIFYLVGVAASVAFLLRKQKRPMSKAPGMWPLALFVVWALLITAAGPWAFAGTRVLDPRMGIDDAVAHPPPLAYNISNLAQAGYLLLAFGVVLYVGNRSRVSPRLLAAGLAVAMVLTALNLVADAIGVPWPTEFFDASPSARYISTTDTGEVRFRGIFTEPSGLALFSAVSVVFFLATATRCTGKQRVIYSLLGALSLVNLLAADSGTATVVGLAIAGITAGIVYGGFLMGIRRVSMPAMAILGAAFFALLWQWQTVYDAVASVIGDKVASSSFTNRTGADAFALDLFLHTWGVGVGLGSNRPSTFLPGLLSTTGLIGVALFVWAVAQLLHAAWKRPEWRPTVLALLTLFLTKAVAGSDLSTPLMWLGLAGCAFAAWSAGGDSAESPLTSRTSPRLGRGAVGDDADAGQLGEQRC